MSRPQKRSSNPRQKQTGQRRTVKKKLAPGKTTEFVVTYEGKTPGPGRFLLVLEGESLGNKPLTKEQEVLVER